MTATLLYAEPITTDNPFEDEIFDGDVVVHRMFVAELSDIPASIRAEVDGLMLFRHFFRREQFDLFPKLRALVRLGVGYDRIDRKVAEQRGVVVCNVPDYATSEVSDHAIALALGLSRGLFLHHDRQRRLPPAPWAPAESPLLRRFSDLTFACVGMGRIGMAAGLKAKALGADVVFYDPFLPSGIEIALGVRRAASLDALLRQANILSLHTPLTPDTRNMIGEREIALLPPDAIIINTARGPVLALDAVCNALKSGHLAGVGLDVVPVEPPVEPLPELIQAVRNRDDWVEGRVVITPHVAFCSPAASTDLHRKAVATMRAALEGKRPYNVISADQP